MGSGTSRVWVQSDGWDSWKQVATELELSQQPQPLLICRHSRNRAACCQRPCATWPRLRKVENCKEKVSSWISRCWWSAPSLHAKQLPSLYTIRFLLPCGLAETIKKLSHYVCVLAVQLLGLSSQKKASQLFNYLLHSLLFEAGVNIMPHLHPTFKFTR